MGGASVRNLHVFKDLCGTDALQNVVFVTNMWPTPDKEKEYSSAENRESQLRSNPKYFKEALDCHAKLMRHSGAKKSAQDIIGALIGNKARPLQIAIEMADKGKTLAETAAGSILEKDLKRLAAAYDRKLEQLKEEFKKTSQENRDALNALREVIVEQEAEKRHAQEELADLRQASIAPNEEVLAIYRNTPQIGTSDVLTRPILQISSSDAVYLSHDHQLAGDVYLINHASGEAVRIGGVLHVHARRVVR